MSRNPRRVASLTDSAEGIASSWEPVAVPWVLLLWHPPLEGVQNSEGLSFKMFPTITIGKLTYVMLQEDGKSCTCFQWPQKESLPTYEFCSGHQLSYCICEVFRGHTVFPGTPGLGTLLNIPLWCCVHVVCFGVDCWMLDLALLLLLLDP